MRTSYWLHAIVAATACSLVAACSGPDAPTTPSSADARRLALTIAGGGSRRGFPGDEMAPFTVHVVDADGRIVPGERMVRFRVDTAAGTLSDTLVLVNAEGRAQIRWRLGNSIGRHKLVASLIDAAASDSATVFAEIVSPTMADIVIVRALTEGMARLLFQENGVISTHTIAWPDTIVRLLPRGPMADGPFGATPWQEVVVFAAGYPPATAVRPWTDAVDTVALELMPSVQVPLTIWITHSLEETRERLETDLRALEEIWVAQHTGLRIGVLRVHDAPEMHGTMSECDAPLHFEAAAINVYYVAHVVGAIGRACGSSVVLMGANAVALTDGYGPLLAHEIGHAMDLGHVGDTTNVMAPSTRGRAFTRGQVFRMHFSESSALNAVLGANAAVARNCLTEPLCLPVSFDF